METLNKDVMPPEKTLAVASDESVSAEPEPEPEPTQRAPSKLDVLVQGVALFSDGYNIQIIGYMNTVLAKLYPKQMTTEVKTRLSNSILIGDIFGMLLFGLCIDRFGRRVGIFLTTFFLVLGIIIATASHGASVEGMFWMMVIGRGVAGVGAGGEYAVCTAQAVDIVSLIVIAAYKGEPSDGIWRICFGIGIILPLAIFVFRLRLVDSNQYKKHAIQHKMPYRLAIKFYWKPLLGCCSAWFLYDAVVYPFNLLAPTLVAGFSSNQSMQESIGWSALINFFALPGAFIGALLMDRIGRRQTYALGWSIVCVFGFVIGGTMFPLSTSSAFPAFVTLYGLFQTFLSVGPGDCNFLVSSESFPTPLRGHFLGFAAAVGKAGAAVGTEALSKALASYDDKLKGQQVVFLIGSAISVVGTLCVWFLIPDHPKALEEEDARFRAYLEENGYDTSQMGLKG
ncbi:hypothetical protein ACJZ2D_008936 [Fusarium nematophilum]